MSAILRLIENAIDVPLMDVKNISKLIYSYIEYEEFEGPLYNLNVRFWGFEGGEKNDNLPETTDYVVFIIDGKVVPTVKVERRPKAEEGGLIINGKNYCRIDMDTFEDWFQEIVDKALNEDRRSVSGVYFNILYNIPGEKTYYDHTFKILSKDTLKKNPRIKKKKSLSKEETDCILYDYLETLLDFYIKEIEKI